MRDIQAEFESHFNEPVLVCDKLARVIGYGEDDCDCYLIVQYLRDQYHNPEGKIEWCTAVGGYYWLNILKQQGIVHAYNGEIWNDFTRLDTLLELNGAPKKGAFYVELWDGTETSINSKNKTN